MARAFVDVVVQVEIEYETLPPNAAIEHDARDAVSGALRGVDGTPIGLDANLLHANVRTAKLDIKVGD